MGNLGPGEIIAIVAVLVLLFGAKKLPELGSSVGKSITNFKQGMRDATSEDDEPSSGAEAKDATDTKA